MRSINHTQLQASRFSVYSSQLCSPLFSGILSILQIFQCYNLATLPNPHSPHFPCQHHVTPSVYTFVVLSFPKVVSTILLWTVYPFSFCKQFSTMIIPVYATNSNTFSFSVHCVLMLFSL